LLAGALAVSYEMLDVLLIVDPSDLGITVSSSSVQDVSFLYCIASLPIYVQVL